MNPLIKIHIDERQIADLLAGLVAKGEDLSISFRRIAGVMSGAVEKNFSQQGRPKWEKLADSTIKARSRKGLGSMMILQDTGRLAASVTRHSDAFSATVGTNTIYAAIHQFGGAAGRGHKSIIPARPFLKLADDDIEEVIDILERHFTAIS